ncbi:hypothetical protein Dd703_2244 [Musicola paradisiaca Ech703]|uniref:Uncharacterized protein n=1 Tax=Musicola paradisiaca (strain Ech703) TaxID=579405 RepID=C6C7T9_MUSP7|nr:hypothetical protein Dd703_2244 [Musicola paradisiaca Ech703]
MSFGDISIRMRSDPLSMSEITRDKKAPRMWSLYVTCFQTDM